MGDGIHGVMQVGQFADVGLGELPGRQVIQEGFSGRLLGVLFQLEFFAFALGRLLQSRNGIEQALVNMEFLPDEGGNAARKMFGVDADALLDKADGHFVQVGGLGQIALGEVGVPLVIAFHQHQLGAPFATPPVVGPVSVLLLVLGDVCFVGLFRGDLEVAMSGDIAPMLFAVADELHGGTLALHVVDGTEGHDAGRQGVGGAEGAGDDVFYFQAVVQKIRIPQRRAGIRADETLILEDAGFADQAAGDGHFFAGAANRFLQALDDRAEIAQFFVQFLRNFFGVQPGELLQFANDFNDGCADAFFVAVGKFRHHLVQQALEDQQPVPDQMVVGLFDQRFPQKPIADFLGFIQAAALLRGVFSRHALGEGFGEDFAAVGGAAGWIVCLEIVRNKVGVFLLGLFLEMGQRFSCRGRVLPCAFHGGQDIGQSDFLSSGQRGLGLCSAFRR